MCFPLKDNQPERAYNGMSCILKGERLSIPARDVQSDVDVTSEIDISSVCLTLLYALFGCHFQIFASKLGDFKK